MISFKMIHNFVHIILKSFYAHFVFLNIHEYSAKTLYSPVLCCYRNRQVFVKHVRIEIRTNLTVFIRYVLL